MRLPEGDSAEIAELRHAYRVPREIMELALPLLEHIAPGARDFKTRVQEALQRRGGRPPVYELVAVNGPDHARSFEVAVRLDGQELGRGEGRSKLEAEQAAAEQALEALGPQA